MSYSPGEQEPQESRDQQSQLERMSLLADISLAGLQLAEALDRSSLTPSETEYSVSVPSAGGAILPDRLRSLGEQLKSLTVSSDKIEQDPRVELDIKFEFDGCACRVSRPAFASVDKDFIGAIGPVTRYGPPGMNGPITHVSLGVDEVSTFLSHAIHEYSYQNEVPLTDPQESEQAAMLIDTLSQRENAIKTKSAEYEISVDGDEFRITSTTEGDRLIELMIVQTLYDQLSLDGGELQEMFHVLHTELHFDDLQTGLQYSLETNEGYVLKETPSQDMVEETRRVIELLVAWTEGHTVEEIPFDPHYIDETNQVVNKEGQEDEL